MRISDWSSDVCSSDLISRETLFCRRTHRNDRAIDRRAMADEFPDPHCLIVADGDVLIRNTLAEYVRNCGYKVFEAATSDEVMLALEEGTVKIDALLADAELSGGFNAFELRIWVRDNIR